MDLFESPVISETGCYWWVVLNDSSFYAGMRKHDLLILWC